ncbi:MAG: hypothetical protein QM535_08510 [Limnohabitans sp.]|nr:hypothetical protein [Limnohabitans sp.]
MTIKDLFRLLLKLFGTYSLVISLFTVIPQNVSNLTYMGEDILLGFWLFLILVIIISLYLFIIFKTDLIVEKLKLDKGFDEDKIVFEKISDIEIYKFAIILLGGFLLIDNLPVMISQIMYIFKANLNVSNVVFNDKSIYDYFDLLITVLSVLIGYLLINNYRFVAEFFSKK